MTPPLVARLLALTLCSAISITPLSAPAYAQDAVPSQPLSGSSGSSGPSGFLDPSQPSAGGEASGEAPVGPPEPDQFTVSELPSTAAPDPTVEMSPLADTGQDPVTTVDLNSDIVVVGVTWAAEVAAPESVQVRYLEGASWSPWYTLEVDAEPDGLQPGATEPMSVTNAQSLQFAIRGAADVPESNYVIKVIDPTGSEPSTSSTSDGSSFRTESEFGGGGDPQPFLGRSSTTSDVAAPYGLTINTRLGWGANESIRDDYDMSQDHLVSYKGAVVHHTAGSNNYSQAQVPGILQGIYWYHAKTQGWGDVGYQLLVDRFGGVWEGRYGSLERVRLGAHARGGNFHTFGISVLGTYTDVAPSAEAQESTARAIAWMFDTYDITNPVGTIWVPGSTGPGRIVDTISGHRQVSITACPGDAFFARLPHIRNRVNSIINVPLSGNVSRFAGTDRFDTAARAALNAYPGGASTVYIAAGGNYPDALAGGPAATVENAPLLLATDTSLPLATKQALGQLRPAKIVILGGTRSIGPTVEAELRQITSVQSVERFGGATRYETAALLTAAKFAAPGTVYLASGENFPDALAAGPVAGTEGVPMLLSTPDKLPEATAAALASIQPTKVVLLGGTVSLSSEVEAQVASITGATITRFGGSDRFVTSAQITRSLHTGTADVVYISSGASFPDALASGPSAAKTGAAMLLIHPGWIPQSTEEALRTLKPKRIVIVGGKKAVSRVLERRLDSFIVP